MSTSHFDIVHEDELNNIIKSTSNSSCQLDPVSTTLLKQSTSALLPTLTRMVNMSLQSGTFPSSMKHSIVVPLLKKNGLPKEELASYRPISHLSFIAKLTERAAAAQVKEYLSTHDLLPKVQSAKLQETSLCRVGYGQGTK